jgi:hypothetical protein
MMSILCWKWSLYSTWPFSLSSFKSSLMLSMLLSVEELELLIIFYCHVFENHLHFFPLWLSFPSTSSYYHQAMVPILRHIVITDFHPVLVAAQSSTVFLLLQEQNMYLNTPPSWSSWNYLSNEPLYAWNGFRTRELCLFYSGDTICSRLISDCAALNVSVVSPCTGLQNWWFLMRWKGDLKDLLNINFSSIVYLWTRAQILMENSDFPLKPCRWLTILIAIGQELMGTLLHAYKNKSNAHSTPGVMVGSRNNYQQTKCIPKILTCGIVYLVKRKENLMSVRACKWKNENERKAYKQIQCLHLVLNTMFTTSLPNSSIAIKIYLSKVKTPCLSLD